MVDKHALPRSQTPNTNDVLVEREHLGFFGEGVHRKLIQVDGVRESYVWFSVS